MCKCFFHGGGFCVFIESEIRIFFVVAEFLKVTASKLKSISRRIAQNTQKIRRDSCGISFLYKIKIKKNLRFFCVFCAILRENITTYLSTPNVISKTPFEIIIRISNYKSRLTNYSKTCSNTLCDFTPKNPATCRR